MDNAEEKSRRNIEGKNQDSSLRRVPPGVAVRAEIRGGPDAEAILGFAAGVQADLIAIGRQGADVATLDAEVDNVREDVREDGVRLAGRNPASHSVAGSARLVAACNTDFALRTTVISSSSS